ncbi:XF1762 family protein [Spongiactinospora sp. TRM90649]|uniref:XF1762 family protein n=1 Tax=Spongiactinospora sp. TRM90649 TaxID=3031114 RepID=UPI0023F7916F|nr:XF1762 family protein [Spongiactinospora sp. TRM90649]MDF5754842.1 hypothetical protein [Spongiactinospora sp. TRM90649]
MAVEPVGVQTARAFVAWTGEHAAPPTTADIVLAATTGAGTLVGVVFAGGPACWRVDDGRTAEVLCLATDGTPNACTVLLDAVWRAALAAGHRRLIACASAGASVTSLRTAGSRHVRGGSDHRGSWTMAIIAKVARNAIARGERGQEAP